MNNILNIFKNLDFGSHNIITMYNNHFKHFHSKQPDRRAAGLFLSLRIRFKLSHICIDPHQTNTRLQLTGLTGSTETDELVALKAVRSD